MKSYNLTGKILQLHIGRIGLLALALTACTGVDSSEYKRAHDATGELINQNYQVADRLIAQLGSNHAFPKAKNIKQMLIAPSHFFYGR